jgi:DNA-binding transcriptional ArsR family regulator
MASADDEQLDRIFRALSDATRRAIYLDLGREPGLTTADLAKRHPRITRWAVMKHLQVLRDAGLIQTLPQGRRRCHFRDERNVARLRDWLEGAATRVSA